MINKIIVSLVGVFAAVSTAFGAEGDGNFAKEFSVSLGSSYVVDYKAPSVSEAFANEYDFNLNVGAQWFFTRNFGVEVNVPFYQTEGVSVSEVQAGLLARFPLSKEAPILKNVAPYVGLGGVYNWHREGPFAYIAKAGVEIRLNPKWGVFTEAQYRNVDLNWGQGATTIAGGLKLVF